MRLPFLFPKAKPGDAQVARDSRSKPLAGVAEGTVEEVQAARVRARRRLLGAGVLLVVGIVVFPMLFETTPRPLPIDTPIDASRADGNVTRVSSGTVQAQRPPEVPPPDAGNEVPTRTNSPAGSLATRPGSVGAEALVSGAASVGPGEAVITTTVPLAVPVPTPAAVAPTPTPAPAVATPKTAPPVAAKPPVGVPAATPAATPAVANASPSAEAIARGNNLEATAAQASAPRFVVQVGAFNEVQRMRDARTKVESLGYKTYITEVDTATGKRTRVRLGPFSSRDDAETAAAKVKTVGLPANILEL